MIRVSLFRTSMSSTGSVDLIFANTAWVFFSFAKLPTEIQYSVSANAFVLKMKTNSHENLFIVLINSMPELAIFVL